DEIIALMEEENGLKEDLKEATSKQKAADNELADKEDVIKKRIDEVEAEAQIFRDKRNALARKLPHNLVRRYADLIKQRNRKAVVVHEKNCCTGCGMKITPQLIIEISRQNKNVACENCGRILVDKKLAESLTIETE
ncbi:MAG: C4-type zinc ribbon domain-containing protein, partial [Candidatus Cloacimonetes bacterium]|nr:C4-type zinc ribbon domain-containing protein [Candidatus Cloacimonadota bacterium]